MGSCASVHYKGNPDSAVKMGVSLGSKKDKLVIPAESSIKDKLPAVDLSNKTTFKVKDTGSKDQIFFDSRPWLESDCEDDFFSINGDFTPSRGNTPVHHSFSVGTPQVSRIPLEDRSPASVPEPSPTGKKTLSEHFQDSLQEDQNVNNPRPSSDQNITVEKTEVKPTVLNVLPKSAHAARPVLGANPICSSGRTGNGDLLFEGDKSLKSARCCFPSLVSCHSLSERKKKMSPAVAANGKA